MECAGCKTVIPNRQFMTCRYCKDTYDLICANVSEKRFYNTMTADHKLNWQCQACRSKAPKQNNSNTPVRACMEDQCDNVTQRKKPSSVQDKNTMINLEMSADDQIQNDLSIMGDTICTSKSSPGRHRTNSTNSMNYEQLCECLFEKLESNKHSIIQEIKSTVQQEITSAISKFRSEFTKETDTLTAENREIQNKIENLNKKISHLESQIKDLSTQKRHFQAHAGASENAFDISDNKKKIVLHGLEEYCDETEDSVHDRVIDIFYNILNINLIGYIEEMRRIGRNKERRPLEIELLSKKMTTYIIKNRHYFRNSKFTITEYLDKNELNKRNELIKVLRNERKNGNHAIIRNNRLYINGREYTNAYDNRNNNSNEVSQSLNTRRSYHDKQTIHTPHGNIYAYQKPQELNKNHSFRD